MAKRTHRAWGRDWHVQELVELGSDGSPRAFAVSDAISSIGTSSTLRHIRRAFLAIRAAGIPPIVRQGQKQAEPWTGRCKGASEDSTFYVLKAKPTEWRFYAVADMRVGVLTFVLAVQKKTDKRDRDDFERCCRAARLLRNGAQCASLARFLDG